MMVCIFSPFRLESLPLTICAGVVLPSPACERALRTVVDTLEKHGHIVATMYVRLFSSIIAILY